MVKKKNEIQILKAKIEELEEKWKRALADYHNLEKRLEKKKEELVKFSNASLIDKLLSVLDSLEKAVDHLKDKGLKLVLDQFKAVLSSEGLSEIKALGEKFDPETMDAVEIIRGKKDRVLEVILKGYRLNNKVLRPAKVKVGKGK